MQLSPRLAAAAVIGVLAIGGGFLLLSGPNAQVGKPSPSPTILGSPKASAEAVQG